MKNTKLYIIPEIIMGGIIFLLHMYENAIILVHVFLSLVLGCLSALAGLVMVLGLGLGQYWRLRSGRALCIVLVVVGGPGSAGWTYTGVNLWDDNDGSKDAKTHQHQVSEYKCDYYISTH